MKIELSCTRWRLKVSAMFIARYLENESNLEKTVWVVITSFVGVSNSDVKKISSPTNLCKMTKSCNLVENSPHWDGNLGETRWLWDIQKCLCHYKTESVLEVAESFQHVPSKTVFDCSVLAVCGSILKIRNLTKFLKTQILRPSTFLTNKCCIKSGKH